MMTASFTQRELQAVVIVREREFPTSIACRPGSLTVTVTSRDNNKRIYKVLRVEPSPLSALPMLQPGYRALFHSRDTSRARILYGDTWQLHQQNKVASSC